MEKVIGSLPGRKTFTLSLWNMMKRREHLSVQQGNDLTYREQGSEKQPMDLSLCTIYTNRRNVTAANSGLAATTNKVTEESR